jgi:hypothetical protein
VTAPEVLVEQIAEALATAPGSSYTEWAAHLLPLVEKLRREAAADALKEVRDLLDHRAADLRAPWLVGLQ